MQRREFINHGSAVMALAASAGLIATPSFAQNAAGWNKGAFDGKSPVSYTHLTLPTTPYV